MDTIRQIITKQLQESAKIKQELLDKNLEIIEKIAIILTDKVKSGKKILFCGNGGSAADCQHLAAELIAKLKYYRKAIPALALTTDTSVITAISNDDGFDKIFKRQVESFGNENDVLIGISTSGHSQNIIKAVEQAKKQNLFIIILTGKDGGKLQTMADIALIVPSHNTQRIQECHITLGHIICDIIEQSI